MKRNPSIQQQISDFCCQIEKSIAEWECIRENGCNDPQWPDGCNMNLVRNHIFYYKGKIKDLCDKYNQELPVEYFLPVPPEVDNKYMADMKCPRAERMRKFWHEKITHKCPDYNSEQLTLF